MKFVVVGLKTGVMIQLKPAAFEEIKGATSFEGLIGFEDMDGAEILIDREDISFVARSTPAIRLKQMWHELRGAKEKQKFATELNDPLNQLTYPN